VRLLTLILLAAGVLVAALAYPGSAAHSASVHPVVLVVSYCSQASADSQLELPASKLRVVVLAAAIQVVELLVAQLVAAVGMEDPVQDLLGLLGASAGVEGTVQVGNLDLVEDIHTEAYLDHLGHLDRHMDHSH